MVAKYKTIPFADLAERVTDPVKPVKEFDYQFSNGDRLQTPRKLLSDAVAVAEAVE